MKGIVLGCGNMSSAIILGLNGLVDFKDTYFYTPSKTRAEKLAASVSGKFSEALDDLPTDPDFVMLACKPQQFAELALKLKGRFTTDPLFISILAATPRSLHEKLLGSKRILRVMPNMSVRFKKGVSLLLATNEVSKAEKSQWEKSFAHLGLVKWTKDDEEFNHLMLLCGSGPAFMYQWLQWMSEMTKSLPQEEGAALATAVMNGALASIQHSADKTLLELISEVTSKAGVTAAVLEGWKQENIQEKLQAGWQAGIKRTEEIENLILTQAP